MWILVALFGAGALAQLIDGTLGMGFGVTNSTFLLTLGLAPAAASASVHTAEVLTSLASGASHLKFGNVDKKALPWLVVPGCIGGVFGALALSGYDPTGSRLVVTVFLLFMGVLLVARAVARKEVKARGASRARMGLVGFVAAAADAFGGGGWGPIATPSLILGGTHEPRKAIGTVNTAEFFVTCAITATFFLVLGSSAFRLEFVAAVALGGVLMAPVGAYLASRVPPRFLGEFVGVLLIALNARALAVDVFHADGRISAAIMLASLSVVLVLLLLKALRAPAKGARAKRAEHLS
jgi:uncharacterized membrane protein YfcA